MSDPFYAICKRSRKCAMCSDKIEKGGIMIMNYKGNSKKTIASHEICAGDNFKNCMKVESFVHLIESGLISLKTESNGLIQVISTPSRNVTITHKEIFKNEGFYWNEFTSKWSKRIKVHPACRTDSQLTFDDLVNDLMIKIILETRSDGLVHIISGDHDVMIFNSHLFSGQGFTWNDDRKRWCRSWQNPTVTSLVNAGELTIVEENCVKLLFGNTFKHKDIIKAEGWIWSWRMKRWGLPLQ